MGAVDFRVLGPVGVWVNGHRIGPATAQQRTILSVLLTEPGQIVSMEHLVAGVWGAEPPGSARNAVQGSISRLRRLVDTAGCAEIQTSGQGYVITADPALVDLHRFRELVRRARTAQPAPAAELLREALGLWQGPVFADIWGSSLLESAGVGIEEERLAAWEEYAAVNLRLDRPDEVISDLSQMASENPLRERLVGLVIRALQQTGRRADALALFRRTRQHIVRELGLEPGEELQQIHFAVLRTPDPSGQPPLPLPQQNRVPRQLPAAVADFSGRARLASAMASRLAEPGGSVMALSAVAGIGGVGKTTLAVQVAHTAREHFPDGQLYIDLQGQSTAPAEPEAVLGAFLRALGTPDHAIPEGTGERSALFRSLLDGRRVLTLLDNARDAAQIRPLLPGTPSCAVLITSRNRMVDLAAAHLIDLDVMSPEEALALFTKIVGAERVAPEREAAMDTVAACGFLPLAIRIAAARLAARPTWTVATLARKLSDEHHRLDELTAGDQAVKATFELGYSQLEPEQAHAFRLLGLAEGPDISLHSAAALLDRTPHRTEDILESLVDTSLIESAAPGRYRFHDLVRLFARASAERDEPADHQHTAARHRLLDHYLASAKNVFATERPGDLTTRLLARTEQPGLAFDDGESAATWLHTEAENILATVEHIPSREESVLQQRADLLLISTDIVESGAFAHQVGLAAGRVVEASREAGAVRAEGRATIALMHLHSVAGRLAEANEQAERALALGDLTSDSLVQGSALSERGVIAINQKQYLRAALQLDAALRVFRDETNPAGEASALSGLARVYAEFGSFDHAIELAREAVRLCESLGLTSRLATARYSLGVTLMRAERPAEALRELELSLTGFLGSRQRLREGSTHFRMAEAELLIGRADEAVAHAERARALGVIGGESRRGAVLVVLGKALATAGHPERAYSCWQEALELFEERSADAQEIRELLDTGGAGLPAP